jgi:hypothetical protein
MSADTTRTPWMMSADELRAEVASLRAAQAINAANLAGFHTALAERDAAIARVRALHVRGAACGCGLSTHGSKELQRCPTIRALDGAP